MPVYDSAPTPQDGSSSPLGTLYRAAGAQRPTQQRPGFPGQPPQTPLSGAPAAPRPGLTPSQPPIAPEGPGMVRPPTPTPDPYYPTPGGGGMGGPSTAPRIPLTPRTPDQPSAANPYTPQTSAPPVAPGTPVNAAGTPTGAETGNLPGSYLSAYGPGQNLIGSQINPNANPNRMDIANQYFNEMATASNPAYEASLRDATQRAAATGSLGSGMLNTSYGNLALQREQNLDTLQRELQTQATEGTIGDQRYNTGVTQQQQAYQAAMAQQALQNRIQQLGTEQAVGAGQAGYLSSFNPYWGITGSNIYGNQAQNAQSQLQQLYQASGLGGALQGILQGGQNSGVFGPNIYSGSGYDPTIPDSGGYANFG